MRKRSSLGYLLDLLKTSLSSMVQGGFKVQLQQLMTGVSLQAWKQKRNCCLNLLVQTPPRDLLFSQFYLPPYLCSPQTLSHTHTLLP